MEGTSIIANDYLDRVSGILTHSEEQTAKTM